MIHKVLGRGGERAVVGQVIRARVLERTRAAAGRGSYTQGELCV